MNVAVVTTKSSDGARLRIPVAGAERPGRLDCVLGVSGRRKRLALLVAAVFLGTQSTHALASNTADTLAVGGMARCHRCSARGGHRDDRAPMVSAGRRPRAARHATGRVGPTACLSVRRCRERPRAARSDRVLRGGSARRGGRLRDRACRRCAGRGCIRLSPLGAGSQPLAESSDALRSLRGDASPPGPHALRRPGCE